MVVRTVRSLAWPTAGPPLPAICRLGVAIIVVGLLLDLVNYVTDGAWAGLWGGEHGPHLIALVGMILTFVGVLAFGALGRSGQDRLVRFSAWSSILAAGLSLEAGVIHLAVVGDHLAEYPSFGALFAILALFQVGWALVYVARPSARLALIAIGLNAGVVIVWAVSRTSGLPVGPEPWTAEATGPLDILASAIEVTLIGVLAIGILSMGRRLRRETTAPSAAALVGSVLLVVAALTLAAIGSDIGHGHHSHGVSTDGGLPAHEDDGSPTSGHGH